MRIKRVLTLVLALCLLLSLMTPAATAVDVTSKDTVSNKVQQGESASTGSNWLSDLIISAAEALGIRTLRDDKLNVDVKGDKLSLVNGQWIATKVDGTSVVLKDTELPEHIQALKKAAEKYSAYDTVTAFVVLQADPMVEQYKSIHDVPAEQTAALERQQDALIQQIEEQVLSGEAVSVVSQFTYLTNSVVIETAFGNLEAIAALDGVKSVFLSPVYTVCETKDRISPYTVSSTQMSGVATVWQELGYTGTGVTIAILDTGLDLDHPSFAADPELGAGSWTVEHVQQLMDQYDLNLEILHGGDISAEDVYYSAKVPFHFNYAMGTTNVSHNDGIGDHGTHVAGISAANKLDGTGVVGMAPDAQLIVMKVFDSTTGGANMYTIVNALEDCLTLGVDVANMSLGSPAGFSSSGIDEIDAVYQRIATTDLIVDVAAGNEGTSSYGSSYGPFMQPTDYIDNATISSPATYVNTIAIGSVDNNIIPADYFKLADGTDIFYMQSVEYLYEYIDFTLTKLAGQEFEYVIVNGLGNPEDFYDAAGNSLVSGKIAVIRRGDITFGEKIANAEAAGAVAAMVWNNTDEDIFSFGMTTSIVDEEGNETYPGIPAILISQKDGQKMADATEKTLLVPTDISYRVDPAGGQLSSFSCWGVAPDLSLLPDIAGVGGNVYSCYDGGQYGIMSGTSMATPQVAGITALMKEYLKEKFPDATDSEMRLLINSLMMSTAVPVIDQDTGVEASPRQQGAGLANALYAITAEAYLTVGDSMRPKGELGDSEKGEYSFTFTVHNFSKAAKTYTLRASLLCEDYMTDDAYPGVYFLAQEDHALDNSGVTFNANTVTVPAGGSTDVTVNIRLTEADKKWIDTYFAYGNYVEGFVYLEGEDEVTLSLPFLGFYGSWDESPLFDSGFWYQDGLWMETDAIEMNEYYHILWTSLGASNEDWIFGLNPYSGMQYEYDEEGNAIGLIYDEYNNVLSPNGDGVLDQLTQMYLSLMRNAEWITLTYTDEEGNVLDEEKLDKNAKTMFISGYGGVVPFVYDWFYDSLYDFKDENGNLEVAHGDKLYLTISGEISYEGAREQILCKIPVYIDMEAPVLDTDNIVESTDENGNYLTLTIEDAHLAYLAVMNFTGTQIYDRYSDQDMVDNGDGTHTITIDVTGLGESFTVVVCDYGCNEAYYQMNYTLTDNYPEVSEDTLYAYQVYNEYVYYNYGWDYIFGWSDINKQNAMVEMISSDVYEYYALTAAEYAGGYVYAVDAGYNLVYMKPGLFNRNLICNIGVNVLDMAFDEVTQTMYLATKTEEEYALYTVDLLTGELELKKTYDSYYFMPWAMTFVDGELYCCKFYYNGFYKVDLEGGTYELTAVTKEDGTDFHPYTAAGNKVSANYSQSMTYSQKDGLIYWAYYDGSEACLITIDPKDWTTGATAFTYDQEYVGLLTVEDDGFVLPESTEITKMVIDRDQLVLAAGETGTLTVSLLPWNAPAGTVTWSTSDGSIATVDDNGKVTAVGQGEAVITATYGDLSVTCNVAVVDISGTLYAYNYYSGDGSFGNFMSIDLDTVTKSDLCQSEVDFIAADYNGHEGLIYGFDEYGYYYSCDPKTGECVRIGNCGTSYPADMAYDYSTGLMYGIVYDYNSWTTTLYAVSPTSGKMVKVAAIADVLLTLACDMNGVLYGISYDGILYELTLSGNKLTSEFIMQTPVSTIFYAQSMCYDHINNVLLWASVENGTIYWVDVHAEKPYALAIGEPTGTGNFEFVGMFVIPEQIHELPNIKATGITVDDMIMLVGDVEAPALTVSPVNTTRTYTVKYTSRNTDVVQVTEDGKLKAVGEGTATVWAQLSGNGSGRATFNVTVKKSTGSVNGFLLSDVGSMDGFYWINIDDSNPMDYEGVDYVFYNGSYMLLYSAEYVDGYIYAYGFDYDAWDATFHYLVINAETWSVVEAYDMGSSFGFVYDMAYDYTTGTMYALMGPSDTNTDLYYVNMENGQLIECMITEPLFMSLAVDANGTLYAMEASTGSSGELDTEGGSTTARLYTLDPATGTYEVYMDTGVGSNLLASMTYDHETGYIYWSGIMSSTSGYVSGLYLIDLDEKQCYNLGTIGGAGAQVTGLFTISDNYPKTPDTLQNLAMVSGMEELAMGGKVQLSTFIQPAGLDVKTVWTSADPSVATVDENGVVTGVSAGVTTITATVTDSYGNVKTATSTVIVYGEQDYFLTYNKTDGGFTAISRPDSTVVNELTSGEKLPAVSAMAIHDGVIYAYDTEGRLFITAADADYQRSYIGHHGIESAEPAEKQSVYSGADYRYGYDYYYTYDFVVRDMHWDEANDRLLILGCKVQNYEVYYWYESASTNERYLYSSGQDELVGGCKIYETDLATGKLTEVVTVGGENQDAGVTMFTISDDGQAYVYSFFMDYVCTLDMETGATKHLSTFQNQGFYGDSSGEMMAMTYDPATDDLYMLITANGKSYYLYKFDTDTKAIILVGSVGKLVSNTTDSFSGLLLNQEHNCTYEIIDSKAATCTEDGYNTYGCSHGVTYTQVLPAAGHAETATDSKAATCTEDGYVTYTCGGCGQTHTDVIPATGHNETVTESKDATCTEDGHVTYTCGNCGQTRTETTPAIGHNETVTESKDATCTEDGYVTYTCGNCGQTRTETTPATGHNESITDSKDATCTEDGHVTYTCGNCGEIRVDTIFAAGHNYVDGTCANCGTAEPDDGGNAETGDAFHPGWVLVLLMISASALIMLVLDQKKRIQK